MQRRRILVGLVGVTLVGGTAAVWYEAVHRPSCQIVGRWRWVDTGDEAEFFPDGQLTGTTTSTVRVLADGQEVECRGKTLHYVGSYWFLTRDRLLMDSSTIFGIPLQGEVTVEIDDDEMRFIRDDGSVLVARRAE
jgi:hypothetical protein